MALICKYSCYYNNCLLVLSNWLVIILRSFVWILLLPKSSHKKLSVILYVLCTICIQYLLLWVVVCSHDPYLFLLLYLRLKYGFTFSLSYSFHLMYMLLSKYMRNRFLIYSFLLHLSHPFIFIHAQSSLYLLLKAVLPHCSCVQFNVVCFLFTTQCSISWYVWWNVTTDN
jgi:hypothetical protein